MNTSFLGWLQRQWPAPSSVDPLERLRASAGALIGILLTGLVSAWALGTNAGALWLAAPMGASAVLLFAVPSSPLAQPWSIVGGNLVGALVGVSCARFVDAPVLAAALAIALAIAAMFALRCIHPPSGAVALTAVLGGAPVHQAGYGFVLTPVGLNTALLLVVAVVYNKAVGRRYPHTALPDARSMHHTADPRPSARLGFRPEDLALVLQDYKEVLDISRDDLEALFMQTEMKAFRRRFGSVTCGQIMSRDVVSVVFGTELSQAWRLMERHALSALPVLDRVRRVQGIVTRADFLAHAQARRFPGLNRRLQRLLQASPFSHSDKAEVVGQIMSSPVRTVLDTQPMVELVPLMSDQGLHQVPVVNADQRLVGMVTQSDLVAALYEASLAHLDDGALRPSA